MPFAAMRMRKSATPAGGYLDALAVQPSAVFSLRKLISTATASIRVRRSSDNAEQDIGFTGDALDTASLAAFVGANSAFVATFYDQTGNGENAEQATTTKQPRIVNAGAYDGKLVFDGTDDFMMVTALAQGTQFAGIYSKLELPNASSYKMAFETGTAGAGTAGSLSLYVTDSSTQWGQAMGNIGGGTSAAYTVSSIVSLTQLTALYDRSVSGADEIKLFVAGSSITPGSSVLNDQTGNLAPLDLYIGARAGVSLFADMGLETSVFYNADTVAIRAAIEAIVG